MTSFDPKVKLNWFQHLFNKYVPLDASTDVRPGAMGLHFDKIMPWLVPFAVQHDRNDDLIRTGKIDMTYRENDEWFIAQVKNWEKTNKFDSTIEEEVDELKDDFVWPAIRAYRMCRSENEVDAQILAFRAAHEAAKPL